MTPTVPDPSVFDRLYTSGLYIPFLILVVYAALKWASSHVAFLAPPNRAHYVTIVLAGLGTLVGPATQGTTPNMSMLISAGSAMAILLFTSGLTPAPKTGQGGFARVLLMPVIAAITAIALLASSGCGPKTEAAEQAFIDCMEESVKEKIPSLLPTVMTILSSGVSDWKAQLEALAAYAGKDALACTIRAAALEFKSKVGGDTSPGSANAAEFTKAHGWTFRP